jgi:hypothetical protein
LERKGIQPVLCAFFHCSGYQIMMGKSDDTLLAAASRSVTRQR